MGHNDFTLPCRITCFYLVYHHHYYIAIYILYHLPSIGRAWNLASIMLRLGFRIDQFFTTSQLALKATKNNVFTYCGPCLQISCPPKNVSLHLELDCCVWHKNFLDLFVCCHFKISDEVPVGLHLGQLCQLFTNSPTPQLKGEKAEYPRRSGESLALLTLCVDQWTLRFLQRSSCAGLFVSGFIHRREESSPVSWQPIHPCLSEMGELSNLTVQTRKDSQNLFC